MTKAELGTKRLCSNCGAKYYDLNRTPIICPRCATQFEGAVVARARPQARPEEPAKEQVEAADAEPAAEFVTLEEADEETAESGAVKIEVEDDAEIETDDDDDEDDDTFLAADDDDENEDVSDIIGDVEGDET